MPAMLLTSDKRSIATLMWAPLSCGMHAIRRHRFRSAGFRNRGALLMIATIDCRNSNATWQQKQSIQVLSERSARYFKRIESVAWELEKQGREYVASCCIHSRTGYYRATARSKDFRSCIDLAMDKIAKQRRRSKSIYVRKRRSSKQCVRR
jgi:ribosomal subunit interface protein